MGKLTRKCCLECPALIEPVSCHYRCMLRRDIVSENGKIAVSIPYSKEPCRKPKSYKEFAEMRIKE